MKNLLKHTIACAIVLTTCYTCSNEPVEGDQFTNSLEPEIPLASQAAQNTCTDEDPQARLINNGTLVVSLEIANLDGTILHTVTNLAPGNASGYLTFAPDNIIFNVTKGTTGVGDEKVVHVMGSCMSFDMEIGVDNYLIPSDPITL